MSAFVTLSTENCGQTESLPMTWPEQPAERGVRPVWIPWPAAVLLAPLFWLMPRRMGPHLATVRWPGVLAAQAFWMLYGAGCILLSATYQQHGLVWFVANSLGYAEADPSAAAPTLLAVFRSPPAVLALHLAGLPSMGYRGIIGTASELLNHTVGIVGLEAALILLSLILTPYAGGRHGGRGLIHRCVKTTFWCSTSLPVLGLGLQVVSLFGRTLGYVTFENVFWLAFAVYFAWVMWMWIRATSREPACDDQAPRPAREPLCEQCGYILTGLPRGHCCPECGTPVSRSLPRHRRPSPFAARGDLLGTVFSVLRDRGFFRNLRTHGQHASARRFAILMCVVSPAVMLPAWSLTVYVMPDLTMPDECDRPLICQMAQLATVWIATSLAMMALAGLMAAPDNPWTKRPWRDNASVAFHATAWLIPMVAAISLALAYHFLVVDPVLTDLLSGETPRWPPRTADALIILGILLWLAVLRTFGQVVIRLSKALRDTRFANG
jgi:hypothetical protein